MSMENAKSLTADAERFNDVSHYKEGTSNQNTAWCIRVLEDQQSEPLLCNARISQQEHGPTA